LFRYQAATPLIAKFEQGKRETNHKIKISRQQQRRSSDNMVNNWIVVDLSAVPHEDDKKTDNDLRAELAAMVQQRQS
jgi:hypothetical protein